MKLFKSILLSFLLIASYSVNSQCLEVTSIFVNSCGNPEGENEMFTFQVGATALNTNNIFVSWPNNSFLGWCQTAGTAISTAALNATITNGCGILLEPAGGVLPANANVITITSTNFNTTFNSFSNLADTMYIIYQCAGNSQGHFANAPGGPKTLILSVSGPCNQSESVSYDAAIPNTDGATAVFTAAGNVSYTNNGCNAPVISLSTDWSFTDEICNDYGVVDLTTLLSPSATTPGTWSGPRVTGSNYNPAGYLGLDSVTYTVSGTSSCASGQDSTIVFNVVVPQTDSLTTQSCDSVFYNGAWYTSSSSFIDTTVGAGFLCESFTNVFITIQSAIIDSSYLAACDSVVFNGTTYYADVILRDTVLGNSGGGGSTCSQLFISEYLEGSSNNKAIEIYNGTGVPVNLANFTIERYTNGSALASLPILTLSGTLADGDVYVIYNPSSAAQIVSVGDLSSGYINHNGDDAYALLESGVIIDVFGNIGCDPGTEWLDLGNGTQDNNYYRLPNYTTGAIDPPNAPCTIPSLNAANWVSTDLVDDFSNLGFHLANCGSGATPSCDSIFITNIDILQPATGNNPGNPFLICDTNDSIQLPGGAYATAAGTFTFTIPNGAANGCDSILTTVVQTQSCGCFFDNLSKTFWVKADTLLQNGVTPVTSGTATQWGNIVVNPLIPNLNGLAGGGTRTIVQNEPTFNFNSTMNFVGAGLNRGGLPNNAMLDPNQGSMFVVSSDASLSFSFVVGTASTGVCGGNRCSSGFRGDKSEYGSGSNLFVGASTNPNVANVLGMSANVTSSSHKNSINGIASTSNTANSIPVSTATVNYSVGLGVWPGFVMTGKVAEAIAFNRELTPNEYEIVESYLALKYGATLNHSYYASDFNGASGTISFLTGFGYDNNIAGLGRDDCFDLEQTISHSVAPGAIVTMALTDNGGTFAAPNSFDNNLEFLTWGNNGGVTDFSCSTNVPAGFNQLYGREWLTQQNGVVGNTALAFDILAANLSGAAADYALVIDTDNDGFYSDETPLTGSFIGGQLLFTNINLDNETFTLVLNSVVNTVVNDQICNNGDYTLPSGLIVTSAGTYLDTLVSASACDSIVTTNLITVICDCSFDLGPDTAFCQGESILLNAGTGFDTYVWQDNSTNQTFTASTTGTYYVATTFIDSANNLVNNGDFQQGNTAFTTDYVPGSGGAFGLLTNPGTYAINTSPSNVHNNFFTCPDHTSGTGNMMIVNGSNTPNTNVWCQTITVVPNTDYVFSAWAMSLENTNAANVATLHFLINGAQFGPNFSPSFTACDWQQFSTSWNSGANASIQICIESDVISGNNDYAIDDIFFTPFCNSVDSIDITVNPIPSPDLGPDLSICQGADTLLDATTAGASYLWQDGATTSATLTAQNAGLYFIDVTLNGCTGRDSLNLTINPGFNQSSNVSICAGDSAFLANAWQTSPGLYTDNYNTTNNCDSTIVTTLTVVTSLTNNSVITVCADELPVDIFGNPESSPGFYADTVSSVLGCDSLISTIQLVVNPLPTVALGSDTTIDAGNVVVLTVVNANATDTYSWTNSLGEIFAGESITTSPTETASYILSTINAFNCSSIDSIMVFVNPITEVLIQLPTAFSPNADGVNDIFRIANYEDFDSYVLRVYNRWGELIFDNKGYNVSWDGTFQGIKQNIGAYAFYIEAQPISGAPVMKISGNVTLIR